MSSGTNLSPSAGDPALPWNAQVLLARTYTLARWNAFGAIGLYARPAPARLVLRIAELEDVPAMVLGALVAVFASTSLPRFTREARGARAPL